jgi:hypothetical protein
VLEKRGKEFENALNSIDVKNRIDVPAYVVIPRAGCSGCISTAEKYMIGELQDSTKKQKVKFILTDFDSEKIILARFGNLSRNKNVIVDPKNIFRANVSLKSIYPTIFLFKGNELIKVTEISPEKDGQSELKLFLQSSPDI